MGVLKMFSSSSQDNNRSRSMFGSKIASSFSETVPEQISLPNPNPANYSVIRSEDVNGKLIIEIKYHDCTNYEGRKIMVYECTLDELMKQKLIDPHFCNNDNYFSPIARFEPTERGWNNACALANVL